MLDMYIYRSVYFAQFVKKSNFCRHYCLNPVSVRHVRHEVCFRLFCNLSYAFIFHLDPEVKLRTCLGLYFSHNDIKRIIIYQHKIGASVLSVRLTMAVMCGS